jgi:hypothetical protein
LARTADLRHNIRTGYASYGPTAPFLTVTEVVAFPPGIGHIDGH